MFNFRTDMADERHDIYKKAHNLEDKIPGIDFESKDESKNVKTTIVRVTDKEGEIAIGKPIGTYITFDLKNLRIASEDEIDESSKIISEKIKNIVDGKISSEGEILVIGLGNQFVTPDSLGPKVVSEIEITRHLLKYAPQFVKPGTRAISAVAPGVLGTTGIETLEIVKGIVDNVNPKLLIVIDSLASKSIERISSTIQISDTGIVPGGAVTLPFAFVILNAFVVPVNV